MNQSKLAKYVLLVLTGMMVVSLLAYYILMTFGFSAKRLTEGPLPQSALVVTGHVVAIDHTDDVSMVTLESDAGTSTIKVLVNKDKCSTSQNIADVHMIAIGDSLIVRGAKENDSITLCYHDSDYLKVVGGSSLESTVATSSGNIYSNGVRRQSASTTPIVSATLISTAFVGTLEVVDTGCFSDGECYVVVDGKHVTVLRGWTQETVGSVKGVEGFGDLEAHKGEKMEVRAAVLSDGTYTLYGDPFYHITLLP